MPLGFLLPVRKRSKTRIIARGDHHRGIPLFHGSLQKTREMPLEKFLLIGF